MPRPAAPRRGQAALRWHRNLGVMLLALTSASDLCRLSRALQQHPLPPRPGAAGVGGSGGVAAMEEDGVFDEPWEGSPGLLEAMLREAHGGFDSTRVRLLAAAPTD